MATHNMGLTMTSFGGTESTGEIQAPKQENGYRAVVRGIPYTFSFEDGKVSIVAENFKPESEPGHGGVEDYVSANAPTMESLKEQARLARARLIADAVGGKPIWVNPEER